MRSLSRFKPAPDRIVVMRAGENHTVLGNVMDGVDITGRLVCEAEHEHPHARKPLALHGFTDVGGDDSQVFGDYRKAGKGGST
jgi:hypothetical protein